MSLIETNPGVIVIDPLISAETATVAFDFYGGHRSKRKNVTVIFTHSPVDHFGGVLDIVEPSEALRLVPSKSSLLKAFRSTPLQRMCMPVLPWDDVWVICMAPRMRASPRDQLEPGWGRPLLVGKPASFLQAWRFMKPAKLLTLTVLRLSSKWLQVPKPLLKCIFTSLATALCMAENVARWSGQRSTCMVPVSDGSDFTFRGSRGGTFDIASLATVGRESSLHFLGV